MTDGDLDEDVRTLAEELHANLEATEELPVARRASAFLGEAQAVAADAARGGSPGVIGERVRQVRDLLDRVGDTENAAVDDRVEAAREVAVRIERRLDGTGDGENADDETGSDRTRDP